MPSCLVEFPGFVGSRLRTLAVGKHVFHYKMVTESSEHPFLNTQVPAC